MIRGSFEFQGQKCSAASRAYVAKSVWAKIKDDLVAQTESIAMGDVTDFTNFMGAVIDDRAFAKHKAAIARVRRNNHLTLLAGGQTDDSVGYFVRPTIVQSTDPTDQMFNTEYFGPILAVHVYDDARYERVVQQMESFAPYALTGAVIAQDRAAIAWTAERAALRRRQLLHQRQADRRGRGPAALRWRARVGHQRQGRRRGQPAALDLAAVHQGDLRPADRLPLPLHGLTCGPRCDGGPLISRPRGGRVARGSPAAGLGLRRAWVTIVGHCGDSEMPVRGTGRQRRPPVVDCSWVVATLRAPAL